MVLSLLRFREMTSELKTFNPAILFQQHWKLELVIERQLGGTDETPPKYVYQ